ncbi:hypothetical protein DAEQUDRAFT_583576 [Daedalea quercina L-15889]|uniref:Uncharacterized protein n=1 Tax=Daedalea quercina L-15889 TaxID=1314783 RepID=A0A165LS35_9APHY|nr:hypothetical protein DAEQUDRAFT_583576 [Daedalea quercina L-15889]
MSILVSSALASTGVRSCNVECARCSQSVGGVAPDSDGVCWPRTHPSDHARSGIRGVRDWRIRALVACSLAHPRFGSLERLG